MQVFKLPFSKCNVDDVKMLNQIHTYCSFFEGRGGGNHYQWKVYSTIFRSGFTHLCFNMVCCFVSPLLAAWRMHLCGKWEEMQTLLYKAWELFTNDRKISGKELKWIKNLTPQPTFRIKIKISFTFWIFLHLQIKTAKDAVKCSKLHVWIWC